MLIMQCTFSSPCLIRILNKNDAMERSGDTVFGNLPEIVENIIWYLDGGSILRAKQVCHLWKETIDHLERYKQLWRHICLRDIHRASLIDIIGFNPLSHDYQQGVSDGCEDDFEDLWKNVYKSWRAGQFLGRCKRSSFKLTGYMIDVGDIGVVQVGAYVYMLHHCNVVLSVWNIDTSSQVLYSQSLRGKLNPIICGAPSQMFAYLQNPLCKFSQHQDMTQHSLIIPADGGLIQWWVFSNGEFHLAKELQVEYREVRVWHNMLVISDRRIMKVFVLESTENEFNFRTRNVSEKFPVKVHWSSLNVWDNRFLLNVKWKPYTIAIYGLDDFQRQVVIVTAPDLPPNLLNPRIFGDFVLTTVDKEPRKGLYVFNTKTGDQFQVKINGVDVSTYKLHGDILIAAQNLLNKVNICRINSSGRRDPVWCTDNTQGRIEDKMEMEGDDSDDGCMVVVPEVFESKNLIYRYKMKYMISYGESIVFLKQHRPDEYSVEQYVY